MGKRTSYDEGRFCWVDLATTDPTAAKGFYGELFGWDYEDMPAPGDHPYTMAKAYGTEVAAISGLPPGMEGKLVPVWSSYIHTADCDATVARWEEAGGTVLNEPLDIPGAGRMASLVDVGGAVVHLWQPGPMIGAGHVNDPGCFCWNELNTRNYADSKGFYHQVFGWDFQDDGDPPYGMIQLRDRWNGGLVDMTGRVPEPVGAFWNVYFTVEDTDATVAAATAKGAQLMVGPIDLPTGRFAVLTDPQGAVFSVIAMPDPDD